MEVIVNSFGHVVRKAYTSALHMSTVPSGDVGVIDDYGDNGAEMADNDRVRGLSVSGRSIL